METNYKKEHEELEINLLHIEISKVEEDNKKLKNTIWILDDRTYTIIEQRVSIFSSLNRKVPKIN